jgi:predicted Zn-dependent protease
VIRPPDSVRVRLLELPDVPIRLGEELVAGLPRPFLGAEAVPLAVDTGPCSRARPGQTDAACLLGLVPAPPRGWAHIALTGQDLFLPALAYVFGVADRGSRKCVLSLARLGSGAGGEAGRAVLVRRAAVEAAHELGHAMGLIHCPVPDCAMHRTSWPEGIDLKRPAYCPSCQAELGTLVESL